MGQDFLDIKYSFGIKIPFIYMIFSFLYFWSKILIKDDMLQQSIFDKIIFMETSKKVMLTDIQTQRLVYSKVFRNSCGDKSSGNPPLTSGSVHAFRALIGWKAYQWIRPCILSPHWLERRRQPDPKHHVTT